MSVSMTAVFCRVLKLELLFTAKVFAYTLPEWKEDAQGHAQ